MKYWQIIVSLLATLVIGGLCMSVAQGIEVRQGTAATLPLGRVWDVNGAPGTGLVLRANDIRLSKNGAAFGNKSDATDPVMLEAGMFACVLNSTDTATAGRLTIDINDPNVRATDPNYFYAPVTIDVIAAKWYDAKYVSGIPEVNVVDSNDTWAEGYADLDDVTTAAETGSATGAASAIASAGLSTFDPSSSTITGTLTWEKLGEVLLAAFLGKATQTPNEGGTHTTVFYDPVDGVTAIFTITTADTDGAKATGGTVH